MPRRLRPRNSSTTVFATRNSLKSRNSLATERPHPHGRHGVTVPSAFPPPARHKVQRCDSSICRHPRTSPQRPGFYRTRYPAERELTRVGARGARHAENRRQATSGFDARCRILFRRPSNHLGGRLLLGAPPQRGPSPNTRDATSAHPPDAGLRLFVKLRVRLGPGPTTPKSASSSSMPGNSFLVTSARSWRGRSAALLGIRAQQVSMRPVAGRLPLPDEGYSPGGGCHAAQPSGATRSSTTRRARSPSSCGGRNASPPLVSDRGQPCPAHGSVS